MGRGDGRQHRVEDLGRLIRRGQHDRGGAGVGQGDGEGRGDLGQRVHIGGDLGSREAQHRGARIGHPHNVELPGVAQRLDGREVGNNIGRGVDHRKTAEIALQNGATGLGGGNPLRQEIGRGDQRQHPAIRDGLRLRQRKRRPAAIAQGHRADQARIRHSLQCIDIGIDARGRVGQHHGGGQCPRGVECGQERGHGVGRWHSGAPLENGRSEHTTASGSPRMNPGGCRDAYYPKYGFQLHNRTF